MPFLPMDAGRALSDALPDSEIKDALLVLERLRAVKSPAELAKLKKASELVIQSMIEVIENHGPGTTKQQLSDALKIAEVKRGLTFEYCLLACVKCPSHYLEIGAESYAVAAEASSSRITK